ncbi:13341_t:CDS:1 [Funneliformis geosporum]|uniref:Phosphatidylglycerol/phosphatidylinositol transfer protein n=1 Tax=Funneliformis geosporum TaxID=1117311 RepID=A0A9W4WKI7_9GLOM|nr:19799_t:CDS:1 [Funneliformis geosporum]CAI2174709.1 13341_t:CDS:1 [Funneliformis geosporum]
MKQFLAFLLILFITLSSVQSIPNQFQKRQAPKFTECKGKFPEKFNVKLSPLPLAFGKTETVTVSGKLKKFISDGTTLRLGISNGDGDAIFSESADFCAVQGSPCPAGPGTKFNTPVKFNLRNNNTPGPFKVLVRLEIGDEILACSHGTVEK